MLGFRWCPFSCISHLSAFCNRKYPNAHYIVHLSSQCPLQQEVSQCTLHPMFLIPMHFVTRNLPMHITIGSHWISLVIGCNYSASRWVSLVIANPWLQAMASLVYYMVFGDGMSFTHDGFHNPLLAWLFYVIFSYSEPTKMFVVSV
jgi:hypothetical protein